jgi:transposase
MNFLAGLRVHGIIAPCVIDGPINGPMFLVWVTQFLVPQLRPGDIVVPDNLGSHKGQAVRRAIRAAAAHRLLLPPYSPDLNPIEQSFAAEARRQRNFWVTRLMTAPNCRVAGGAWHHACYPEPVQPEAAVRLQ